MGEINQRVALAVVDAVGDQLLEVQAPSLVEDRLAVPVEVDVACGHRPGRLARDGRVRGILESIALLEPVDHAALEIGQVTGHALNLGVLDRLDDVVSDPVRSDLSDDSGLGRQVGGRTAVARVALVIFTDLLIRYQQVSDEVHHSRDASIPAYPLRVPTALVNVNGGCAAWRDGVGGIAFEVDRCVDLSGRATQA